MSISKDATCPRGFLRVISSQECFGFHLGAPQSANLGDGNGWVNQTVELRQDYGDIGLGTCLESLIGGNHLRFVIEYHSEVPV